MQTRRMGEGTGKLAEGAHKGNKDGWGMHWGCMIGAGYWDVGGNWYLNDRGEIPISV